MNEIKELINLAIYNLELGNKILAFEDSIIYRTKVIEQQNKLFSTLEYLVELLKATLSNEK